MSVFEKTKKAMAEKSAKPLTVLDRAQARFEKLVAEKDAANLKCRARVAELLKEKEGLVKEHNSLAEKIKALTADYLQLQDNLRAEQKKLIAEDSVTEDDLKAGRVDIREFFAAGKKNEQIRAEATAAADQELKKARDVIRLLKAEQLEIIGKVRKLNEDTAFQHGYLAENFFYQLKAMQNELQAAGATGLEVTFAHQALQEAHNDLSLLKGAVLFHAATWTVKSMAEAEAVMLDPRLQEKHFPEFRAFLDEIKGLDFAELTFHYLPCEFVGRSAGSIWYSHRPKVVTS